MRRVDVELTEKDFDQAWDGSLSNAPKKTRDTEWKEEGEKLQQGDCRNNIG